MKSPDLPNPRDLVLNKEVDVTSGIHGHTHQSPIDLKKYFTIHNLED